MRVEELSVLRDKVRKSRAGWSAQGPGHNHRTSETFMDPLKPWNDDNRALVENVHPAVDAAQQGTNMWLPMASDRGFENPR